MVPATWWRMMCSRESLCGTHASEVSAIPCRPICWMGASMLSPRRATRCGRSSSTKPDAPPEISQPRGDGLGLCVVLHHFPAHLAAPTGLLVSAKWPSGIAVIMSVDTDCAGFDFARHQMGNPQILRPDAGLQAVFRVIREFGHRIQIVIVKGLNANHRTENFLAHHTHVPIGPGQHGGFHEITRTVRSFSAGNDLGAFVPSG